MTKSFAAAVISALALAPACTDLTEVPSSAITPQNFYKNEAEAIGGLASVYAQLRTSGASSNYYEVSEISSDEMVVPIRGQNWSDNGQWLDIHHQSFQPNTTGTLNLINPAWNDLFTGVARANIVLNGMGAPADIASSTLFWTPAPYTIGQTATAALASTFVRSEQTALLINAGVFALALVLVLALRQPTKAVGRCSPSQMRTCWAC